jgi:hypothetical protein
MTIDSLRYRSLIETSHTIKSESKSKGGLQLAFGLSHIAVPYLLLQEMLAKQTGQRPVRRRKVRAEGYLVVYEVEHDVAHDVPCGTWCARI